MRRHLALFLGLFVWLAACEAPSKDSAQAPAGNGTGSPQSDSADATSTSTSTKEPDGMANGGSGTFADAGESSDISVVSGNGGIGLKPGGAQDIAFFRSLVKQGKVPAPGDMTIEGWLNEHDTPLPKPLTDRTVSLHALAAVLQPKPEAPAQAFVQIGLNSGKQLADVQEPFGLIVAIDRSGSMQSDGKMAAVKDGLTALVDAAPSVASVGLVSFSSSATTDVAAASLDANQRSKLKTAIQQLLPDGGTNLGEAMETAIAQCKLAAGKSKRILLLSDGQATEGQLSPTYLVGLASKAKSAGCSVSTVGVGLDFDVQLMLKLAQSGDGTAWFVEDADHAKEAFLQDLETMVLPVAQGLQIQFKLAAGWQVKEIFGFEWTAKGDTVTLGGQKQDPVNVEQPPQGPQAGQVGLPTLFASKRNGLVMAQLEGPPSYDVLQAQQLKLASVNYGYALASTGAKEQFEVPVQVDGIVKVPDQGAVYYASPIVRRAWLLLATGQDLIAAVQAHADGQTADAKAILTKASERIDAQKALPDANLLEVDTSTPDLADAKALVLAVRQLLP